MGATETTVDGFTTSQAATATPLTPMQGNSQTVPEALGGHRDLSVQLTSSSGEVLLAAAPSFDSATQHLLHFDTLSNSGTGTFTVAWDGANTGNPPALNSSGLSSANLAAGNATGFSVLMGADHDGSTATFKIYKDATDWSSVTVPVPGPGAGITASNPNGLVYVPFSSFTTGAGTGAGDFSKVGAVVLQIAGNMGGLNGQVGAVTTVAPTPKTINLANTPEADLQITKTDNKTSVVPGTHDTYTVVVTNAGPNPVTGASVVDNFPSTFTNVTYTATATGGATGFSASGSGSSLNQTVNLPVGSTITYLVTGLVGASATGTLSNTASVAAPSGVTDPTPGNNVATDTDTLTPQADLQITKTDYKTSVVPGTQDTYTVVVTNAGPSAVTGASVVDNFPSTFTNVTYTATATGGATGFSASGSGSSLNQTVNMPVGSTITYLVTGLVSASATGTLSNTASVAAPSGVTDPTPGNNVATDTDTLTPQADLQITKTDYKTSVVPGTQDTYTVVVTNAGPSAVTGASVVDNFPGTFTNVTYTATASGGATGFSASGSGSSLNQTVNMPVGSTITYTVTGLVSATATGTLSNTASVTAPSGVTDPTPGNNVATDTDTITPEADLQITKTDNKTSVVPGTQDTYTVVVTNAGPSAVTGASVVDNFPSTFTNVSYTATATGGATGFSASGSGSSLNQTVNMPVGSTITYTVTGLVSVTAAGTLSNTATVTAPEGVTDPTPGNNVATDTDTLTPQADLQITKTDNKTSVVPGTQDTYTVVVTNAGPSAVTGASVVDNFPSTFTNVTYTATATGGASGLSASGSGSSLNQTVNMPVGSTITYTVTGLVSSSAVGLLSNTASVTAPEGVTDPTPGNNVATDTDTLTPQADLQITKTDNKTSVVPGTQDTYTIVVTNAGPSDATSPSVVDYFPSTFTNVSYTATGTGGATGYFNGSGRAIIQTVNLPAGATITYTVTGTVSSSATGTLSNSATVNAPNGLTDPTPGNNVAIDTDTLTPQADLQITKTDNKTSVVAGAQDTYTIVVTNAGPSDVTGASIVDYFPSTFTNVSYTASGTGGAAGYFNGSGSAIIQTVNLPAGATITFLVTGTVSSSASGTLTNTATVNAPLGVTDPTLANNVATDTDTVTPIIVPHIVPTPTPLSKSQFLGRY